jgi:tRNA nucleotidyltransferase (CCA-adding enzyme)
MKRSKREHLWVAL